MPLKPKEIEKIILADGWVFLNQEGSHRHYVHPDKKGKVTIPFHPGDLTFCSKKSPTSKVEDELRPSCNYSKIQLY